LIVPLDPAYPASAGRGTCRSWTPSPFPALSLQIGEKPSQDP
jgi:hypothetical protein